MKKNSHTLRRTFLKSTFQWSLAATVLANSGAWAASEPATYQPREKKLRLHNTHTKESLEIVFFRDGKYDHVALTRLYVLLRDHRENEAVVMDKRLFEQLWELQQRVGGEGVFEIISGYRSPKTNSKLRKGSSGVAKKSYHLKGQAIDVRLRGTKLAQLHKVARGMKAGGVGYYPGSDFIHLDTGPVRSWS